MGMTKQRQAVLEIVQAGAEHYTAEQVYDRARKKFPDISMGTVYRNLNILADTGMIRRLHIADEPVRFDRVLAPHEHLVCDRCGKIMDMPLVSVRLSKDIAEPGTRVLYHTLVVHCVCAVCAGVPGQAQR